jgi:hypothetical protein
MIPGGTLLKSKLLIVFTIVLSVIIFAAGCSKSEEKENSATPSAAPVTEQPGNEEPGKDAVDPVKDDNTGQIKSDDEPSHSEKLPEIFKTDKAAVEEFVKNTDALKEYKLDLGQGFEGFDTEVNDMYCIAVDYMKIGAPIPSIYGFTFAQGSVSALRYAVGLLLKEKGTAVEEDGLICDWDEIYGLSLTTPVPYFMEAVFVEKTDAEQAKTLREYGALNPLAENMVPDTGMLKGMGTDSLKQIYDKLTVFEKKLYEICAYVPQKGERIENGFSSTYHMLITMWYLEHEDMAGAAEAVEKLVLTAPFSTGSYAFAAYINLGAGDLEKAAYYVNNGLLLDDRNGDVNLFASIISYGIEDIEKAGTYLAKAKQAGVSEQYLALLETLEKSLA